MVGAPVNLGDEIAKVGSVGNSLTGHIHFMVKQGGTTIGVSFTDVSDDNGIPRTFGSYTSGNRTVP
jgi:murein DD-endopeptidase MepM/ murein hydrolase activator NlpD